METIRYGPLDFCGGGWANTKKNSSRTLINQGKNILHKKTTEKKSCKSAIVL
jgi:hypothetical protein